MRFINRLTVLIVIGVVITTALPILAAISLARQQGRESEEEQALGLARSALTRTELTGRQLARARAVIDGFTEAEACSDEGLDLMQRLDLSSTLLQGVGWMDGNVMRCSSFRGRNAIDLGPVEFVSALGTEYRTAVTLFDPAMPYVAVQTGHSVGIVHRDLALSFVEDIPGLDVSAFSWSQRVPLLSRGSVPAELIERQFTGNAVFRSGGRLVAVVRSKNYDLGAIAVLPAGYGSDYATQAASVLIPIGVIVGLILSAMLIYVIRNRASMPMMIRSALKHRKFQLLYQPVVDLGTGRIKGVEALIRWPYGEDEFIPPDVFIPVAEEEGLIPLVTARVFELLAEDARYIARVAPDLHFAVNLSAQDMHRTDILAEVNRLVERSGIAFENLVIEATERSLVDVDLARETMAQLRARGIKVAIDDFGTGYSSLAYLAQLEVDYLKIDKLFVQALGTDSATNQVAGRIIDMARDLGLSIVAEGIETEAQRDMIKRLGVEYAQGYLFGRPMPAENLLQELRTQREAAREAA